MTDFTVRSAHLKNVVAEDPSLKRTLKTVVNLFILLADLAPVDGLDEANLVGILTGNIVPFSPGTIPDFSKVWRATR
jgi:hypothetical protein